MSVFDRVHDDLESEAALAFERERLLGIPSTFGRIIFLASLRNGDNGRYRLADLARRFGDEETDRVLRLFHAQLFGDWLNYSLEHRRTDIEIYLTALRDNKRDVLQTWLRLETYRNLIPEAASDAERQLYLVDVEAVLAVLKFQFENSVG